MPDGNRYCSVLRIDVPRLEAVKGHPEANYYSLLIVVLLECGVPVTLAEAAERFAAAGVASAANALSSLKRCKPGRPPIYRDGDCYALDPHDDEADLWAFRLGLRPPKAPRVHVVRPQFAPLPPPQTPLSAAELDEAWRQGVPGGWSAQRVAACVLDAHQGTMSPEAVLAFVRARSEFRQLTGDSAQFWRRGAAVQVDEDGRWRLDGRHPAVRSARLAVRERIAQLRRVAESRPDRAVIEAQRRSWERRRAAHAEEFARLRRVIVHAFPAAEPAAVVLLDVGERKLTTFGPGEIGAARETLDRYDYIAAIGVRSLLRHLSFDPDPRWLAELGPPRKTRQLNQRGRVLRMTTELLIQGTCSINRPFGDAATLGRYLEAGDMTRLRRRLEADAKSLFALYQYGRLHGAVRLRWGFLDEMIPVPWVHRDEPTLLDLIKRAKESGQELEVVTGAAPGWADPWARALRAYVVVDASGWARRLVDDQGAAIDIGEIQLARLAVD